MINESLNSIGFFNNIVVQFIYGTHNDTFINNEIFTKYFKYFYIFLIHHFIIFNKNNFNDFIMYKLH